MTTEQIRYILNINGFNTDEWTTLYIDNPKSIGVIGLSGDNNIIVNPTSIQFFFDTTNELLYTKKYYGNGKPSKEQKDTFTIEVEFEDNTYYFEPSPNQLFNEHLGYISEAIDFNTIVSILPQKNSVFSIY